MTTAPTNARQPIAFAGNVASLVKTSVFATGIASITGILPVFVFTFPFSLLLVLWPLFVLKFFWNGVVWATPVTLLLLPAVVAICWRRPMIAYFALPVAGLLGGALTMKLWSVASKSFPELFAWTRTYLWVDSPPSKIEDASLFFLLGAFAGFIAGVFYSASFREMRR